MTVFVCRHCNTMLLLDENTWNPSEHFTLEKDRQTVVFHVRSNVFDGSFSTQFMSQDLSKIETLQKDTFEELLTAIDESCYQRIPRSVKLQVIYEADLDR